MDGVVWRLEMFGGLRLFRRTPGESEGVVAPLPKLRKAQALLAFLALQESGEAWNREELAEHLWPGDPPEFTQHRLKQALYLLRRELEPAVVIQADRLSVGLVPEALPSDAIAFTRGLRTAAAAGRAGETDRQIAALTEALAQYRGELLPGFFEDYLLAKREALGEQRRKALLQLSTLLRECGDFDEALTHARTAATVDVFSEDCHAAVLQAHAALGHTGELTRYFRALTTRLTEETGEGPSATLTRLFESLRARQVASPTVAVFAPVAATDDSEVVAETVGAQLVPCPPQMTRFFGRATGIGDLCDMLTAPTRSRTAGPRIVTLTGAGGTGKTRLAIETAGALREQYAVAFAGFADLISPARILDVLAEALGITLVNGTPDVALRNLTRRLVERMASADFAPTTGRLLIVLDNLEHIAEAAATTLVGFLREYRNAGGEGDRLALLITSRHRLEIDGEQEFVVDTLSAPRSPGTPERLSEFPSVQLFVDRARAVCPSFALTPGNATKIAELCLRLDGLPLAIELAAAWSSVLTPEQLLQRLNSRFDILVSRRRDTPDRHRSLRAAIESGITLLPAELRRLFAALSIFRGGWTLEAAEQICTRDDEERAEILTQLLTLQRRSLVVAEPDATGAMRFRCLETLRTYGDEMLRTEPERRDGLLLRHSEYMAEFLLEQAKAVQTDVGMAVALRKLDTDIDNIRAAIEWSVKNEPETALWLSCRLWRYCEIRGQAREGRALMEAAIAASDGWAAPTDRQLAARAANFSTLANMLSEEGFYDRAEAFYLQGLAIWRSLDRPRDVATALSNLAIVDCDMGRYDAAHMRGEEALACYRSVGDAASEARVLTILGNVATYQCDLTLARAHYSQSLTIKRRLGNPLSIAISLNNLSRNASACGDSQMARQYAEEALALRREHGDRQGIAASLDTLARNALAENDSEAACRWFQDQLIVLRETGRTRNFLNTVESIALISANGGDAVRATKLLAGASTMRQRYGLLPLPVSTHLSGMQDLETNLRDTLEPAIYEQVWQSGETLSDAQLMELALAEASPVGSPAR